MDNIARFSLPDINNPDIPFAFLKKNSFPESGTVLAADVGGTKTNMGLFTIKDSSLQLLKKNRTLQRSIIHSKRFTNSSITVTSLRLMLSAWGWQVP